MFYRLVLRCNGKENEKEARGRRSREKGRSTIGFIADRTWRPLVGIRLECRRRASRPPLLDLLPSGKPSKTRYSPARSPSKLAGDTMTLHKRQGVVRYATRFGCH